MAQYNYPSSYIPLDEVHDSASPSMNSPVLRWDTAASTQGDANLPPRSTAAVDMLDEQEKYPNRKWRRTPDDTIRAGRHKSGASTSPVSSLKRRRYTGQRKKMASTSPSSSSTSTKTTNSKRRASKPDAQAEIASAVADDSAVVAPIPAIKMGDPDAEGEIDDEVYEEPARIEAHDGKVSAKQKAYRAKNLVAAKRCREKQRQSEVELAAREQKVTAEHEYLNAYVASLKEEVLSLKSNILRHGDCQCDVIQRYISRAAGEIGAVAQGRLAASQTTSLNNLEPPTPMGDWYAEQELEEGYVSDSITGLAVTSPLA